MNTKLVMTASAAVLGVLGLGLTFMPTEAAGLLEISAEKNMIIIFQLLGALYFGFAMINWNTRRSLIGGIYNKPIAMGNFSHFLIAGMALLKNISNYPELPFTLVGLSICYLAFAILFGFISFTHPLIES